MRTMLMAMVTLIPSVSWAQQPVSSKQPVAVIDARSCDIYRAATAEGRQYVKQVLQSAKYKQALARAKKTGEILAQPRPNDYQGKPLATFLEQKGFKVRELWAEKEEVTADTFRGVDLVIRFSVDSKRFQDQDVAVYVDYVKSGGHVLLLCAGGVDKIAEALQLKLEASDNRNYVIMPNQQTNFGRGLTPFPNNMGTAVAVSPLPNKTEVYGYIVTKSGPQPAAGLFPVGRGKVFFIGACHPQVWAQVDWLTNILLVLAAK